MHELSLCAHILNQVELYAKKHKFGLVSKITLVIGQLSGIELDAMQFSFPIAAKNTIAENAKLAILTQSAIANCQQCQKKFDLKTLFSACPYCNSFEYDILQGKTLTLKSIEGA